MNKKIISLVLSVLLLLSVGTVALATDSGYETKALNYKEAANTMQALGFAEKYSDEDLVNKRMTRAEFITVTVKMLNHDMGVALDRQLFYDVPLTHTSADYIGIAYTLGLISGSDGYFNPDSPITLEQAAKIVVSMLGYNVQAERAGGYPTGYFVMADRLGITKGIEGPGKLLLKNGVALQMLFNSLEVDLILNKSVEGDDINGSLTKGKNILTEYHDLIRGEGIVTSTPVSSLSSPEGTKENMVKIDNVLYDVGESSATKYLGYHVIWYADEDMVLQYAHLCEKENEMIKVDFEDLAIDEIDSEAEEFVYYDETEKKRTLSVSKYADFLYNGVSTGSFDPDLVKGEGYIEFIDNNRDGVSEVVKVYASYNIIVDTVDKSTRRVFGKYSTGKILDLDDTSGEKTVRILSGDNDISFSAIQSNNVLSVYESINTKGKKHIQVIVSQKVVVGTIDALEDNGARITVGEDTYDVSAYLTEESNPVLVGTSGRIYLDAYDRVVHFTPTNDGEFNVFHYGYLLGAQTGKGLDKTVSVKMLTATNKIGEFTCVKNIKVDGFRPLSGDDVLSQLATDEGGFEQVVRYKMNETQEITELDTVQTGVKNASVKYVSGSVKPEDTDNLKLDIPFPKDATEWRWISTASAFGLSQPEVIVDAAETKVLVLPQEGTKGEESDYEFTTRSHFISSDYYQIACYNLSEFKVADLAVVHRKTSQVRDSEHIALIDKITSGLNKDGEPIENVSLIYRGQKSDYKTKEAGVADGIKQGDVVRFATNAFGEIIIFEKLVDEKTVFDVTSVGSGAGYFYANMNTYTGVVHKKEGNMIIFSTSKDANDTAFQLPFMTLSAQYALYSRKAGKVVVSNSSEFDAHLYSRNPDAVIVLGCYGGRVEDIYILDYSE